MQEKIGNIILDDTYYGGEDLYSEGAIEEELLETAKNCRDRELAEVVAAKKSWPFLYHFSPIRQNIVSWIPFQGTDNVLEIGAGCGAITGALAQKCGHVTCVELSKKRSQINAWRNRDYDNTTIMIGNFLDVEPHLGTYDYITLIGVFEYAESYMGEKEPAKTMLQCMAKHLAPGGKPSGIKILGGLCRRSCRKIFRRTGRLPQYQGSAYLFQERTDRSHPPVRRIQDHFLLSLSGLQIPILHLF